MVKTVAGQLLKPALAISSVRHARKGTGKSTMSRIMINGHGGIAYLNLTAQCCRFHTVMGTQLGGLIEKSCPSLVEGH